MAQEDAAHPLTCRKVFIDAQLSPGGLGKSSENERHARQKSSRAKIFSLRTARRQPIIHPASGWEHQMLLPASSLEKTKWGF
jgi:hypothetical protein